MENGLSLKNSKIQSYDLCVPTFLGITSLSSVLERILHSFSPIWGGTALVYIPCFMGGPYSNPSCRLPSTFQVGRIYQNPALTRGSVLSTWLLCLTGNKGLWVYPLAIPIIFYFRLLKNPVFC